MMLEDASVNSSHAITAAEKVLRPEQWAILPQAIRERPENAHLQLPSRKPTRSGRPAESFGVFHHTLILFPSSATQGAIA